MRIAHASLNVLVPERSLAFYKALGFEDRGCLRFPSRYYLYLGLPCDEVSLELGVHAGRHEPYNVGDGFADIALMVPDLDRRLAMLAERGIVPLGPPYHPHGRRELRICVLVDPDGYRIELIEGARFNFPRDPATEPAAVGNG